MKKSVLIIPIISLMCYGAISKNLSPLMQYTLNQSSLIDSNYIKSVLKYRDSINNNIAHFKLIKKKDLTGSTEGGNANLYLDKEDTVKIEITYFGETGKSEYTFYLKRHKVILFTSAISYYKTPIDTSSNVEIDHTDKKDCILKNFAIISGQFNGKPLSLDERKQQEKDIKALYKEVVGGK